jgi:hypothetical protein
VRCTTPAFSALALPPRRVLTALARNVSGPPLLLMREQLGEAAVARSSGAPNDEHRAVGPLPQMTTISEAFLAFHDALDRIEAERREPTAIEDRTLRTARPYLHDYPDLAVQILRTVPDASRNARPEHVAGAIRTIAEWRENLRTLSN